MTLRRTHTALAALATATLVLGVGALRVLPGPQPKVAPAPKKQSAAGNAAVVPPAAVEPGRLSDGLAAPFLRGLRAHLAVAPEHSAVLESPSAEETVRLENPEPSVGGSSLSEATPQAPFAEATPERLADLGLTAAPSPPSRPRDVGAGAEFASAPLPPPRPPELATSAPATEPSATAPAPAQTQEATLQPAPAESFAQSEQTPARFNMGAPAYVRIFKKEGELELWLKTNGRYTLYRAFPICKWSGRLGPKLKEADYQSPEGFYSVSAKQLHPHSNYHRAFNVGYPNAFDRQNGRTGGLVMVHGNCKSVGCFAMTDQGVEEIYGFVAAALAAGQREVPVHIFPFRMTDAAIARETGNSVLSFLATESANYAQWSSFWRNLKEGYDLFEKTGEPPVAYACGDHYAFGPNATCTRIAGW